MSERGKQLNRKLRLILTELEDSQADRFEDCRAIVEKHGLKLLDDGRIGDETGKALMPWQVPGWNRN